MKVNKENRREERKSDGKRKEERKKKRKTAGKEREAKELIRFKRAAVTADDRHNSKGESSPAGTAPSKALN